MKGVSPLQVKQGSQRKAGVEGRVGKGPDPARRGHSCPGGGPGGSGGGTQAESGQELRMKVLLCLCSGREAGETREGEDGAGGVLSRETEKHSLPQAHGAVGLETHRKPSGSPQGHATARCILVLFTTAPKGDATFQSVRRGERAGPGAQPLHPLVSLTLVLRWPQQSLTLSRHPAARKVGERVMPEASLASSSALGISRDVAVGFGRPCPRAQARSRALRPPRNSSQGGFAVTA